MFLAGWSIGIATRNRDGSPEPRLRTVLRLLSRTIEVYRAQITTMALALAMIAGTALVLDNPLLLEWHNAGGYFADPIQTTVGFVLLTHQLGFFNILPLYVVLLGIAPVFVLIAREEPSRGAGALVRPLRGEPGLRVEPALLAGGGGLVLQPPVLAAPPRAGLHGAGLEPDLALAEAPGAPPRAARNRHRADRNRPVGAGTPARSAPRARPAPRLHLRQDYLSPAR